jgi:hypothetical protein
VYDDAGRLAKKWVTDQATGEAARVPALRPPNSKPPCDQCAKCQWSDEKTPEEGKKAELTARNRAALEAYYQRSASGGSVGPTYRRKFGIIEQLMEQQRMMDAKMCAMMSRMKG